MVKKAGLRRPKQMTEAQEQKVHEFAEGVFDESQEKTQTPRIQEPPRQKRRVILPWERSSVREDVIKGMGVPLSEPYLLKLRFIAENTKWSQRKFCQAKVEEAIDREVKKILGTGEV